MLTAFLERSQPQLKRFDNHVVLIDERIALFSFLVSRGLNRFYEVRQFVFLGLRDSKRELGILRREFLFIFWNWPSTHANKLRLNLLSGNKNACQ